MDKLAAMVKSVWEFLWSVGRWWWVIVAEFALGVFGLIQFVEPDSSPPAWAWVLLFGSGLALASFVAFHRMRIDRDRLADEVDELRGRGENCEPAVTRVEFVRSRLAQYRGDGPVPSPSLRDDRAVWKAFQHFVREALGDWWASTFDDRIEANEWVLSRHFDHVISSVSAESVLPGFRMKPYIGLPLDEIPRAAV